MLGAIAEIFMAAGFGFTFHPASGRIAARLLVCSRSTSWATWTSTGTAPNCSFRS